MNILSLMLEGWAMPQAGSCTACGDAQDKNYILRRIYGRRKDVDRHLIKIDEALQISNSRC
jgi:hypothetical protein